MFTMVKCIGDTVDSSGKTRHFEMSESLSPILLSPREKTAANRGSEQLAVPQGGFPVSRIKKTIPILHGAM